MSDIVKEARARADYIDGIPGVSSYAKDAAHLLRSLATRVEELEQRETDLLDDAIVAREREEME